jgi:diaminobutyrate-2-oxoglutarate transaminase
MTSNPMSYCSKALSGIGVPVAIILHDERLDTWPPGAHTGTFRGNQLAFAAGVETIRIVHRDDVLGNVRRRGEQIARALEGLRDHPWVRDVRVVRLMPPLNVTEDVIDTACTILFDTLQECCPSAPSSPGPLRSIS